MPRYTPHVVKEQQELQDRENLSNTKKEENLLVKSIEVRDEQLTKLNTEEAKSPAVYTYRY